jgi:hypothetical protein
MVSSGTFRRASALLFLLTCLTGFALMTRGVNALTTVNYGNLTLASPFQATNWNDLWDLTKGDLTLTYTIDMSGVTQPAPYATSYTEIGIRENGAGNFNPGPFNTYQGGKGGWMTSLVGDLTPTTNLLSLMDKHNLGASGGRGEGDYDCVDPNTIIGPFGTTVNYGIWFDRDGVDPWQAGYWGSVDGSTYNTGGIYDIVITYHAINSGLGSMFALVNGIPTGFYNPPWKNAPPDKQYPAGLSFKGNMSQMQVFAGIWAPTDYGPTVIHDLTVSGVLYTPPPPPVGGEWLAIDNLKLLTPLATGLASLATLAGCFVYVERRKKKQD